MKRSYMKRKVPLRAKSLTKVRKPRRKLEDKTKPELVKVADKVFSKYVRLRDSEIMPDGSRYGDCIDMCGKRILVRTPEGNYTNSANAGHYVTRGRMGLRFRDENVNLQSAHCNAWADKITMIEGYARGLDLKYGEGTAAQLKQEGQNTQSLTKQELLNIIKEATETIAWYEGHS